MFDTVFFLKKIQFIFFNVNKKKLIISLNFFSSSINQI